MHKRDSSLISRINRTQKTPYVQSSTRQIKAPNNIKELMVFLCFDMFAVERFNGELNHERERKEKKIAHLQIIFLKSVYAPACCCFHFPRLLCRINETTEDRLNNKRIIICLIHSLTHIRSFKENSHLTDAHSNAEQYRSVKHMRIISFEQITMFRTRNRKKPRTFRRKFWDGRTRKQLSFPSHFEMLGKIWVHVRYSSLEINWHGFAVKWLKKTSKSSN